MENSYTQSQIRNVAAALIKGNDNNLEISDLGYDTCYIEGVHDGLIDLLNELSIIYDFQYMNY